MKTNFIKLTEPNNSLVEVLNRWENDPTLVPLTRPNQNKSELECQKSISVENLIQRLEHEHIYLIYQDDLLIGEMNYMVDPGHLYKKESGTAWIGITIGESEGRGKGIGFKAIRFLEDKIREEGLRRIELGVFEFNNQALKLYQKLGYNEIGRIKDFTYFQGKMWNDIRMEKWINQF
ncbi:GNAT family N-acetyltransferase [Cytobacillus sp. IB215665]|uniref:GNAT family N-acetyltransferase n=1 Tax=Cytobacillus sp. IB215665 TaxID=3097357 RepID=UPI002A0B4605|nr:GNAT family N-acetyltransferase [Cytobacillus sp. IB215665]MDX8365549.1 GNAT family N-acetyltransferase [Cytobacillus sp. IB215665]